MVGSKEEYCIRFCPLLTIKIYLLCRKQYRGSYLHFLANLHLFFTSFLTLRKFYSILHACSCVFNATVSWQIFKYVFSCNSEHLILGGTNATTQLQNKNLLSRNLMSRLKNDNRKYIFPPFFHMKIMCFVRSLWAFTLGINCTKTKNVMKDENVIVKMVTVHSI